MAPGRFVWHDLMSLDPARVLRRGAPAPVAASDIPGNGGRFAGLQDPAGARCGLTQ